MRQAILLGFLLALLVCGGCVKNASAQGASDGWKLCTSVSEFPIQISGTDIVMQKVADDMVCLKMDTMFFQKVRAAGFRGKASASAVEKWLPEKIKLPHEHMLMIEADAGARILALDFCH